MSAVEDRVVGWPGSLRELEVPGNCCQGWLFLHCPEADLLIIQGFSSVLLILWAHKEMFSLALEADASLVLGVTSWALLGRGAGCLLWKEALSRRKPELNMDLEIDFLTPHSRKRGLVPGCGHSETGIQALFLLRWTVTDSCQRHSENSWCQALASSMCLLTFYHPGKVRSCSVERRRLLLLFRLNGVLLECFSTGQTRLFRSIHMMVLIAKQSGNSWGRLGIHFRWGFLPLCPSGRGRMELFGLPTLLGGDTSSWTFSRDRAWALPPVPSQYKRSLRARHVTLPSAKPHILSLRHHWEAM